MKEVDLSNAKVSPDMLPTTPDERNWGIYNFFALWIGMDIGIPTYYLASGLVSGGMNLLWAMITILLANIIIAFPILANGHAGAKYGIPSTIYWRSAFGFNGASVAAIIRGVVAAGWFGIQIWIGGSALNTAIGILSPWLASWALGKWVCFAAFWALNILVLAKGMGALKKMENWCAPLLVLWMIVLLIWARKTAGSWGPLVNQKGTFATTGAFLAFFIAGLNSNISYWGPMPLTVTDFTKHAKDQRSHYIGQFIGIPSGIFGLALVGSLVTSCTVVIFGKAVWDPVTLTGMMDNVPMILGCMCFLMIATITTNVAANAVSPCVAIVHLSNGKVNFKWAAVVLGILAVVIQPWRLIGDLSIYMNCFLNGGGALLGPIIGLTICHYFFICHTELDLRSLYFPEGESMFTNLKKYNKPVAYFSFGLAALLLVLSFLLPGDWAHSLCTLTCTMRAAMIAMAVISALLGWLVWANREGGINPISIFVMVVSFLLIFCGLWIPTLHWLYDASIIIGTLFAMLVYYLIMKGVDAGYIASKKELHNTEKAAEAKKA
jgi:NCS1 family nucleobase:cation symporter-1